MPVVVEHVGVGFANGVRHDPVAHEAAVHEEELGIAIGAREAGGSDEALERDAIGGGIDLQAAAAKSSPAMRAARARTGSGGR
jgi:hypothetical protein